MKIVKMHKGNKEAFDDFLKQRLNEVEVDNDAADKYFAEMNLPVPVLPETEISFFAQHKNKLWLWALLFCTGITTITFLYNSKPKNNDVNVDKKYTSGNSNNAAFQPNSYPTKNKELNTIKQQTTKLAGAILLKNNKSKIENVHTEKTARNSSNKFLADTKKNNYKNGGKLLDSINIQGQKISSSIVEQNITATQNGSTINTTKEPIKTDKKQADSLYIIW